MADNDDLLAVAWEKRELAAHFRRLAQGVSANADQARLLQKAREIEAEAEQLERQAEGSAFAAALVS